MKKVLDHLSRYSRALGPYFPYHCANLLVAAQYVHPLYILMQQLDERHRILDWGCGTGHFSYLLRQAGYHADAYAFSLHDDLSRVKEKMFETFHIEWPLIIGDPKEPIQLPYASTTYDCVISLGVLEHVRETGGNERASLHEIYRILKPGGLFCCFHFPNRYSWIEALARSLNTLSIPKYSHPLRYTRHDIVNLVRETPFTLQKWGLYNVFPRSMLHLLPKSLGMLPALSYTYGLFEKGASLIFKPFSQNFFFILKKGEDPLFD